MSGFNFGANNSTGTSGGFNFGGASTNTAVNLNTTKPTGFALPQTTPTNTLSGLLGGTSTANPGGGFGGIGQTQQQPTASAGTGFSFGTPSQAPATASTGFTFGGNATQPTPAAVTTAPATGLSFGGNPSTGAPTGFAMGFSTATTSAATTGLGSAPAKPLGPGGLGGLGHFNFGNSATSSATLSQPSTQAGQTISLGGATKPLGLATANASTTQPTPSLSLGGGLATTGVIRPLGGAPLINPLQPATSGVLRADSNIIIPTTAPGPALPLLSTSQAVASINPLGGAATSNASTLGGTTLGGKPLSQPTAATTTSGFSSTIATAATSGASMSTVTNTTSSAAATAQTMNYRQLEEQINKWSLELEEQEKIFIQQATQVNAWDRLLIDNGDKIAQLNTDVERVKLDQQRLDQELDFISGQQKELEELLVPLEQAVEQIPPINYQQHADLEREHTYKLAENIDAQLKRMVQDLKEIIDHINTSNTSQDNNDPVQQISKVLNAHMDSLQWIDQNSSFLQRRVDEVAKIAEQRKKDQERNFRLAYD